MAQHFLVNVASLSGSRVIVVLSQILVLPIVARYLEVSEFGDVALAMTVVVFAQLLSDAGLGRSLIRKGHYDAREWSSVFWFLVGVGLLLAAALIAIAPVWGWLFDRPTLTPLVTALSVVPLLSAMSAVPTAYMERQNRFPALATISTTASIAGFVAALSLAIAGAGAWALIGQQITIAAVQGLCVMALAGVRPLSPRARIPLGGHLTFARNTIGVSFLYTAQRQTPMMLIGYVLGVTSLGLYSMSQRIQNLPQMGLAAPFSRVAFVHMSAVQNDPARIGRIYNHGIVLMATAIFPPMAVLAGAGETAFAVLLSEAWIPAAQIFALAAIGVALETATNHAGVLLQVMDRTDLRLRMALERLILRLVLIVFAIPYGVMAVAAAISLSALGFLPRVWNMVGQVVPFSQKHALSALAWPSLTGIVLFVACRWVQSTTAGEATLWLALVLLLAAWVILGLWLRTPLRSALDAFSRN